MKLISGGILNENQLKTNLGVDLLPFPNVQKQTVLQFLNNNLVPQWLILSGTYKITDDFEHINDDFQLNAQKYDTDEKQKLTISTGFILKEESQLIKEIIKSKISFILLEGIIYKAFCISPKLVELESDQNLINYELEFLIVK